MFGDTNEIVIPAELAGKRVDQALTALLPHLSRQRIQALMAAGMVMRADGTPAPASKSRARTGDVYHVLEPPPAPAFPGPEDIPLDILFEDDDLLVLNKPRGLVVHPAPGNPAGTLVNAVLHHCRGRLSGVGGVERPGIVHRLDKNTSGLMVVAKTDAAHRGLAKQFEVHSIERAYHALVWGAPNQKTGMIKGAVGRDPRNRKRMAIVSGGRGKPAVTHFRRLERVGSRASILECRLETGRTHQIRVHLSSIGHPVVGDLLYTGGRWRSKNMRIFENNVWKENLVGGEGQIMHAYKLNFTHPISTKRIEFDSTAPDYFDLAVNVAKML